LLLFFSKENPILEVKAKWQLSKALADILGAFGSYSVTIFQAYYIKAI